MQTVNHQIVEIALKHVQSADFERFIQAFYSAIWGADYVPLGGMHDGGADGWLSGSVFRHKIEGHFLQASTTSDTKTKIRHTINRLREYGRSPTCLTYCTSTTVGSIDTIEIELSDKLECRIVIRDAQYFTYQVNQSPQTIQAFNSYLAPAVDFLKSAGAASLIGGSALLPSRTLCVFIGQELDRRSGQTQLLEAVTDSLILWSLEGTNPDKGEFMSRTDIERKVMETLPSANTFFRGVVEARLNVLKSKASDGGRKVNFHSSIGGYCLPFATREIIEQENIEDEALRLDVSKIFRQRASEQIVDQNNNQELIERTVEVCHEVIQKTFLFQGLELSLFLENDDDRAPPPSIQNYISDVLDERGLRGEEAGTITETVHKILRQTFYKSTSKERIFLGKLSRTYVLMFLLKNEPRIVEYLRSMTSNFCLYVGADIIVQCLSEHMFPVADQMNKNALRMLKSAGSQLILTDKTLDEVWHHLQTSHLEFINNYCKRDPSGIENNGKILISAYFNSQLDAQADGKAPITWNQYVSQFCSVEQISKRAARDELREYLINEFKFELELDEVMEGSIDHDEWAALSNKVFVARNKTAREDSSEKTLSRNAAATVLRVYARRKQSDERPGSNPYGYRTWWMTQQTRVRAATGENRCQGRFTIYDEA